ncbi:DUF4262 domain-containing protein [Nocardioides sp. Root140]|uniref:DUF4262 domain-containing protein n=1 Tax=Nocardioides sp. Root140 TaxID=1736460 RepID=UPI0006FF9CF4|nr:DUF4262 domain-containing protein [Nocardioides sp. Root140]KQY61820.1 hypothetical protein ASD30_25090 [Nocardioides sp. Root140]
MNAKKKLSNETDALFANIRDHGHQVQVVFGGVPFAYSIGRILKGRPEIFVTGPVEPQLLGMLVNAAAAYDDDCELPFSPVAVTLPAGSLLAQAPARVVAVDPHAAEMFAAINFAGFTVPALQIILPDPNMKFPGEPGADPEWAQVAFALNRGEVA